MKLLFVLFTLLSHSAWAGPCDKMKKDYKINCQRSVILCNELESCKKIRNKCNTNVSTHEGCNRFMGCIGDYFKGESEDRSCLYQWSGQPSDQNKCENMNYRDIHILAQECPGFAAFAGKFNDTEYNCQGHTKRLKNMRESCEITRVNLRRYCDTTKPELEPCDGLKTKVVINNDLLQSTATPQVSSATRHGGADNGHDVHNFQGTGEEYRNLASPQASGH